MQTCANRRSAPGPILPLRPVIKFPICAHAFRKRTPKSLASRIASPRSRGGASRIPPGQGLWRKLQGGPSAQLKREHWLATLGFSVGGWRGEVKDGAPRNVDAHPHSPAMRLDN